MEAGTRGREKAGATHGTMLFDRPAGGRDCEIRMGVGLTADEVGWSLVAECEGPMEVEAGRRMSSRKQLVELGWVMRLV